MKNRIEEIRKVWGINQEELAKALCVSRQSARLRTAGTIRRLNSRISCPNISG